VASVSEGDVVRGISQKKYRAKKFLLKKNGHWD